MTDAQVVLHPLAPQIQIAVLQAKVLIDGFCPVAHLEGKGSRRRQHGKIAGQHFPPPGFQVGVGHAGGAKPHRAAHGDHILAAQFAGVGVHLYVGVGSEHHLHGTGFVPQSDEDDAAVVAAAAHPTVEHHFFAEIGVAYQSAFHGSFPA